MHGIRVGLLDQPDSCIIFSAATVCAHCRYIASVYWTLTTCTTVGYGDIVAISDLERVYAIFVLIGGAG